MMDLGHFHHRLDRIGFYFLPWNRHSIKEQKAKEVSFVGEADMVLLHKGFASNALDRCRHNRRLMSCYLYQVVAESRTSQGRSRRLPCTSQGRPFLTLLHFGLLFPSKMGGPQLQSNLSSRD